MRDTTTTTIIVIRSFLSFSFLSFLFLLSSLEILVEFVKCRRMKPQLITTMSNIVQAI